MKKFLAIFIIFIVLLGALWLFWPRSASVPLTPTSTATTSPFGSGDSVGVSRIQPDFEGEVPPVSNEGSGLPEEGGNQKAVQVRLFRVSALPVAGFVLLSRASTTVLRFVDRGTGHITDASLASDGSLTKARVTNQTLPQIYEAYFRPDGAAALLRSLDSSDSIKNMAIALKSASSTSGASATLSMTLLRGTIDSVSAASQSLYYEAADTGALLSSDFAGEKVKTWWLSGFPGWRTSRLGANMLVFTKPSASIPGLAYSLSPTGSPAKLAGPLNGLDALGNAAGTAFIYSYVTGGTTRLFTQEVGNKGPAQEIVPGTLADKCAWSAKTKDLLVCGAPSQGAYGNLPDDWYQGKAHFSDDLWQFNTSTGAAQVLAQPESEFGVSLDVTDPALSPDDAYLAFINKTDLSLWVLRLK